MKGRTSAKELDPGRTYPLDVEEKETDPFSMELSIVYTGKIEGRPVGM